MIHLQFTVVVWMDLLYNELHEICFEKSGKRRGFTNGL